jgi:uncharacterized protein involved in exopolysaccharide biosynthesis
LNVQRSRSRSDELELDARGEDGDAHSAPTYDLTEIVVYGVARWRKWVVAAVVAGAVCGLIAGASRPNTYTSQAKLILRLGEREEITSETLVGQGEDRRDSRPTMQDEIHLLSDEANFERVARDLGPAEVLRPADPTRYDGPETPLHTRLLHLLQRGVFEFKAPEYDCGKQDCADCRVLATRVLYDNTLIATDRSSNVILVTHTSTSPEKAQAFTQAIVTAFIARHAEQFSLSPYLESNQSKLDEARERRDSASKAYFDHIQKCGFIDLDTQRPALLAETDALETSLFSDRVRREEIDVERRALNERLKDIPREIERVTPAVKGFNAEYETEIALKRSLIGQRRSLALEALPIEEQRRREKEIDTMIKKVDQDLVGMERFEIETPEVRTKEPNPAYTTVRDRIDELNVNDLALRARVAKMELHLREKRAQVEQLGRCENTHALLGSLRKAETANYDTLFQRYSMLEALSSLDLQESSNLRVLQPASYNAEKDGPKRSKILLMGVFLGVSLGVAYAALRQILDTRLRYPGSIERVLGLEVLGVVPQVPVLENLPRRALSEAA